jgi:Holliday junction DNA helicase RuvA
MIGYLRGIVLRCDPQLLLLDVGGVGYEVHVPQSTYDEIVRHGAGAQVAVHVHTHVREDAIQLFGFSTESERQIFLLLLGVTGIGPRLGLTILSGLPPADLTAALAAGDLRRLSSISGVGKKTAERMVVELKEKAQLLAASLPSRPVLPPADDDLVTALVNLGYRRSSAEDAVGRLEKAAKDAPFPERLRLALKLLSRV